jgi:hypothetical protein
MVIHDDLIKEFKIKKNVTLQASDIWESRDLTLSYISDKKLYVLLEGDDDSSVSGDARRAAASDEYKQNVAALALCSNKLHEKIIGSLFLNINKPKVPTKFFDNKDDALVWLKNIRDNSL